MSGLELIIASAEEEAEDVGNAGGRVFLEMEKEKGRGIFGEVVWGKGGGL